MRLLSLSAIYAIIISFSRFKVSSTTKIILPPLLHPTMHHSHLHPFSLIQFHGRLQPEIKFSKKVERKCISFSCVYKAPTPVKET
ncbi:hypothetical protein B0O99DRAFT_77453 [Bisporella sp. PMI_857]|nr:hypothetical protein B0O99DRAFT_77453 [Bisporella sp. PMI_857]